MCNQSQYISSDRYYGFAQPTAKHHRLSELVRDVQSVIVETGAKCPIRENGPFKSARVGMSIRTNDEQSAPNLVTLFDKCDTITVLGNRICEAKHERMFLSPVKSNHNRLDIYIVHMVKVGDSDDKDEYISYIAFTNLRVLVEEIFQDGLGASDEMIRRYWFNSPRNVRRKMREWVYCSLVHWFCKHGVSGDDLYITLVEAINTLVSDVNQVIEQLIQGDNVIIPIHRTYVPDNPILGNSANELVLNGLHLIGNPYVKQVVARNNLSLISADNLKVRIPTKGVGGYLVKFGSRKFKRL